MLADEIAQLLAGTGHPMTEHEIAKELGRDWADVRMTLLYDGRFEPAPSTWSLLVKPEGHDDDSGEKPRSTEPGAEAGSTPPAPRADFSPGPSARASSRALGHPLSLAEVARHDPLGMLHAVHWTRHAARSVLEGLAA